MLGEKYNLEVIDIFNDDGTINDKVGLYVGMDRFDVRRKTRRPGKQPGPLGENRRLHQQRGLFGV